MLTKDQAREIVDASIRRSGGEIVRGGTLLAAGISQDKLGIFVKTLVTDAQSGVPLYQHFLDPNIVGDLRPEMPIDDVAKRVLELSAGKLCSNPVTPHPQTCCPYPAICEECGFAVL